jgi:hypothetical protein
MNDIDYKAHGFKDTGFGCTVRATEISVWIVYSKSSTSPFGVYMFHGAPAGQFWRNSEPLVRCANMVDARLVAERLFGITGSDQFAQFVVER